MFSPRLWWHGWPAGGEGRAMGQVLHGSATTTEAIRRAIQRSEESVRALARRPGISPITVQKWRKRQTTANSRMGPKEARSTILSPEQEAIVVAFRRHMLLPLDDCLYALQPSVPGLTRSNLHRCLARHGISRLPEAEGGAPAKKRFKPYPIGHFHLDTAEVRTEQGKLHLFVAVDRTSKFAFAQLHERATRRVAANFPHALVDAVPYRLHTVLTDNGVQFTDTLPSAEDPGTEAAIDAIWAARGEPRLCRVHAFDHACERHGIEHGLTKPYHPWTNGQVERMNRTLKDATVRRYHYASHDEIGRASCRERV